MRMPNARMHITHEDGREYTFDVTDVDVAGMFGVDPKFVVTDEIGGYVSRDELAEELRTRGKTFASTHASGETFTTTWSADGDFRIGFDPVRPAEPADPGEWADTIAPLPDL